MSKISIWLDCMNPWEANCLIENEVVINTVLACINLWVANWLIEKEVVINV